jgi:hypothetical protein
MLCQHRAHVEMTPARTAKREPADRPPLPCYCLPRHRCLQLRGHGLDLGVGLEDLVAHLAAPAGLLVAAERQGGVEDVVAVDPDGPGPELLGQGVGLGDVLGPDAGAQGPSSKA